MKNESISRRLSLAIARATLLAALVIGVIFAAINTLSVENRFQNRIAYLSDLARSSLALPLWNVDLKTVEELLDTSTRKRKYLELLIQKER